MTKDPMPNTTLPLIEIEQTRSDLREAFESVSWPGIPGDLPQRVERLCDAATRAGEREKDARKMLINVYRGWHGCGLKVAERGIPAGTLCDSCLAEIDARMNALSAPTEEPKA